MTTKMMKQFLSVLACSTLLIVGTAKGMGQQDQTPPPLPDNSQPTTSGQDSSSSATPAVALQSPDQLDTLVAPIALYPDALVAQVLAASEYPEQVAFADDWLAQNKSLSGAALAQAVDQQSWDPSVKALTQFPSVLHNLAQNLAWTSNLGDAFTNQQSDVMAAVQAMRARAQAAGNLKSSSQITVVQESPSTIVIKPANPEVVYVPQYNPTLIYGAPYIVPSYVPPVVVVTPGLYWSSGVTIGGGWGWGGFGWGWGAWNLGWGGGGNVVYNNNIYINRTTNNFNYHPWGPGYGPQPGGGGFGPGGGGYHPLPPSGPQPGGGGFGPGGGGYHPTGGAPVPIHPSGPGGMNGSGGGYHPTDGGYRPPEAFHPGQSYNPAPGEAQRGFSNNNFGRNNSPGAFQRRSYMSGNGFHDQAASQRGWGSMRGAGMARPMRMSPPPRMGGGGFRRP